MDKENKCFVINTLVLILRIKNSGFLLDRGVGARKAGTGTRDKGRESPSFGPWSCFYSALVEGNSLQPPATCCGAAAFGLAAPGKRRGIELVVWSGRLGFVVPHPFAKSANGWGTRHLWEAPLFSPRHPQRGLKRSSRPLSPMSENPDMGHPDFIGWSDLGHPRGSSSPTSQNRDVGHPFFVGRPSDCPRQKKVAGLSCGLVWTIWVRGSPPSITPTTKTCRWGPR
jgi:hypothetical protein